MENLKGTEQKSPFQREGILQLGIKKWELRRVERQEQEQVKERLVEQEKFTFFIAGNCGIIQFRAPVVYSEGIARETVRLRLETVGCQPFFALIDGRSVTGMHPAARQFLKEHGEEGMGAMALLLHSPVEQMVANFYLSICSPEFPTQCFTGFSCGIRWLERNGANPMHLEAIKQHIMGEN